MWLQPGCLLCRVRCAESGVCLSGSQAGSALGAACGLPPFASLIGLPSPGGLTVQCDPGALDCSRPGRGSSGDSAPHTEPATKCEQLHERYILPRGSDDVPGRCQESVVLTPHSGSHRQYFQEPSWAFDTLLVLPGAAASLGAQAHVGRQDSEPVAFTGVGMRWLHFSAPR